MTVWDLPGPSAFIERILSNLRDGKSVVVVLPLNAPTGASEAIGEKLDASGWYRISLAAAGPVDPARWLFDATGLEPDASERRNASTLVRELSGSRVLLVDSIHAQHWNVWRDFVLEFERASRDVAAATRPLLLLVGSGIAESSVSVEAPAVSVLRWQSVIDELDTMVLANSKANDSPVHGSFERLLRAHAIAKLAMWDLQLAEEFTGADTRELLDPERLLFAYAQQAGWAAETPATWELGTMDRFSGRSLVHSALLAVKGESEEIRSRVWSAQAALLLPIIETQRRSLLHRARKFLRFPIVVNGEEVVSADDLEVGALHFHLRAARCTDSDLVRQLDKLRRARNALAHIVPVETNLLFDPQVHGFEVR
jgi:hypothetical protein